jgi:NADPH:quinone reductase-like Zn-dependent oxidoreductase
MAVVGLLEVVAVPQGGWLLVTAAGSTLGKMLAQVAKGRGIKVVGTVRRAEQVEEVKAAG